ncbi:MAG: threonine synthase [Candidatus Neomarinimicrobiota bacterium]
MGYLTHLECSYCCKHLDPDRLWNLCPDCSKPLFARYDIDSIKTAVTPQNIALRNQDLWRYFEILPIRDPKFTVTLGEGFTPLINAGRIGQVYGLNNLTIKDEGSNPTGSFKARGMGVAVSRAFELGVKAFSIPSAGNAAGALSAYAALADIPAKVFMPKDVPHAFIAECRALGADIELVDGLITDAGKKAARELTEFNRFDMSTLKEPYRIEGKKTMGYEIAEQMDWTLPDVIIYPTGGGTGLIGMWKAFEEMEALGWIGSARPRMVAVQSSGCAPIVKAFQEGKESADYWENAATIAEGLRVPAAIGDFLILRALRESDGTAISVKDDELIETANDIGSSQGIFVSPESASTLVACRQLVEQAWLGEDEKVVLFSTGSGYKYHHLWRSI